MSGLNWINAGICCGSGALCGGRGRTRIKLTCAPRTWWRNMSSNVAEVLVAGAVSSGAVAGMAAARGQAEGHSRWEPINAISHIVWGPLTATRTEFTWRHTGVGLVLNGVACGFWAV